MSIIKFYRDIARPEKSNFLRVSESSLKHSNKTIQNSTKGQNQLWSEIDCSSMRTKMDYHNGFDWQKMKTILRKR